MNFIINGISAKLKQDTNIYYDNEYRLCSNEFLEDIKLNTKNLETAISRARKFLLEYKKGC